MNASLIFMVVFISLTVIFTALIITIISWRYRKLITKHTAVFDSVREIVECTADMATKIDTLLKRNE